MTDTQRDELCISTGRTLTIDAIQEGNSRLVQQLVVTVSAMACVR